MGAIFDSKHITVSSSGVIDTQNLVLYSEDLTNVNWVKLNTTITANQGLDLNGNNTLDLVNDDGNHNMDLYQTGVVVLPSTDYVLSFDVKRGTTTGFLSVYVYSEDGYVDLLSRFDYSSQTSSNVSRVSFNFTTTADTTLIRISLITDYGFGTSYFGRVQVATPGKQYITTTNIAEN